MCHIEGEGCAGLIILHSRRGVSKTYKMHVATNILSLLPTNTSFSRSYNPLRYFLRICNPSLETSRKLRQCPMKHHARSQLLLGSSSGFQRIFYLINHYSMPCILPGKSGHMFVSTNSSWLKFTDPSGLLRKNQGISTRLCASTQLGPHQILAGVLAVR